MSRIICDPERDYPKDVTHVTKSQIDTLFRDLASRERVYDDRYIIIDRYKTERYEIFLLSDTVADHTLRGFIFPYAVAIHCLVHETEYFPEPKWLKSEFIPGFLNFHTAKEEYNKRLLKYTAAKIQESGFIERVDDLKNPDKPVMTEETEQNYGLF